MNDRGPRTIGFAAPPALEAELFIRSMKEGRNGSILVHGTPPDGGASQRCVVKLNSRLTVPPLEHLCEWVASVLASHLGLRTPAPFAVEISQAFAESIADAEVRKAATGSLGCVFGSSYIESLTPISAAGIPEQVRCSAVDVLAFDLWIHNIDRRATNPNLAATEEGIWVFDHDLAFSFLTPSIGAPDPVTDPMEDALNRHALRAVVRGLGQPGLERLAGFQTKLAEMTDEVLASLRAVVPPEWCVGAASGKLERIIEVLARRRDAASQWIQGVGTCVK